MRYDGAPTGLLPMRWVKRRGTFAISGLKYGRSDLGNMKQPTTVHDPQ
jgi:hypothetical protein